MGENVVDFWEARYHSAHTPWDRGTVSPALKMWLADGTLVPSAILVPGCGNGYEVVELVRRGFDVTAVDIAPSPVAVLARTLAEAGLTATVLQADVLDWRATNRFAAIYEQTCLCALAPALWQRYVGQLYAWLQPGGKLCACFMQTGTAGGPPFDCPMNAMRGLFAAGLWSWPSAPPVRIPHPAGFHELALVLTRR